MKAIESSVKRGMEFPKLPPLPFLGHTKRYGSAVSTACGTPTPHSDQSYATPVSSWRLHIPVARVLVSSESLGDIESPRIERAALVGIEPEPVAAPSRRAPPTPACRRLYEFRCPPMPKTNSVYKQAKKAEYDGDYETAMQLYIRAIDLNDRAESAVKDYAGLLHMRGKTKEAIGFLEERGDRFKTTAGFKNLLSQLQAFISTTETDRRDLPKLVYVAIEGDMKMRISYTTMASLFPNHLKVSKITFVNPLLDDHGVPQSDKALVEFASHSAARKALNVTKHNSIRCLWAPDSLLEVSQGTVRMQVEDVCLVALGPLVKVSYAVVPEEVVGGEWPKLLAGRVGNAKDSESPKGLQLPIIKRSERPMELDIASIETSVEEIIQRIDWCLNTPSPVRHVACLL